MTVAEVEEDINDKKTYIVVEVEELLETDWPPRLAARLGYPNVEALVVALKRWQRRDLARRLARVEWDGLVPDAHRTIQDRKLGAEW